MINQVLVQVGESNARLHNSIGTVDIDLKYSVHVPSKVQNNTSTKSWSSATISRVATDRSRPKRNLKFVGNADDGLEIRHRPWTDHSRGQEVILINYVVGIVGSGLFMVCSIV